MSFSQFRGDVEELFALKTAGLLNDTEYIQCVITAQRHHLLRRTTAGGSSHVTVDVADASPLPFSSHSTGKTSKLMQPTITKAIPVRLRTGGGSSGSKVRTYMLAGKNIPDAAGPVRFRCTVAGCQKSCGNRGALATHVRAAHSESAQGPISGLFDCVGAGGEHERLCAGSVGEAYTVCRSPDEGCESGIQLKPVKRCTDGRVGNKGSPHRRTYTIQFKMEVLGMIQSGATVAEVAARVGTNPAARGIPKQTLREWVLKAGDIEREYSMGNVGPRGGLKAQGWALGRRRYEQAEQLLLRIVKERRSRCERVTLGFLSRKALQIVGELGERGSYSREAVASFRAGRNWRRCFMNRWRLTVRSRTNKKVLAPSERVPKWTRFFVNLRRFLRVPAAGCGHDPVYGRFQPFERFNVDQTPLNLNPTSCRTVEFRGASAVQIRGVGRGDGDKRFCTLQVCVRASGKQPRLCVIFRGERQGKLATEEREKKKYDQRVDVLFQPKAWADREACCEWITRSFSPFLARQNVTNALLFCDNLDGQVNDGFLKALKESGCSRCLLVSGETDALQPVDAGIGKLLKTLFYQEQELWLEEPGNLAKWECVDGGSVSMEEKRVLTTIWAACAWKKLRKQYADTIRKCFVRTGCLLTIDGSERDEIQPMKGSVAFDCSDEALDEFEAGSDADYCAYSVLESHGDVQRINPGSVRPLTGTESDTDSAADSGSELDSDNDLEFDLASISLPDVDYSTEHLTQEEICDRMSLVGCDDIFGYDVALAQAYSRTPRLLPEYNFKAVPKRLVGTNVLIRSSVESVEWFVGRVASTAVKGYRIRAIERGVDLYAMLSRESYGRDGVWVYLCKEPMSTLKSTLRNDTVDANKTIQSRKGTILQWVSPSRVPLTRTASVESDAPEPPEETTVDTRLAGPAISDSLPSVEACLDYKPIGIDNSPPTTIEADGPEVVEDCGDVDTCTLSTPVVAAASSVGSSCAAVFWDPLVHLVRASSGPVSVRIHEPGEAELLNGVYHHRFYDPPDLFAMMEDFETFSRVLSANRMLEVSLSEDAYRNTSNIKSDGYCFYSVWTALLHFAKSADVPLEYHSIADKRGREWLSNGVKNLIARTPDVMMSRVRGVKRRKQEGAEVCRKERYEHVLQLISSGISKSLPWKYWGGDSDIDGGDVGFGGVLPTAECSWLQFSRGFDRCRLQSIITAGQRIQDGPAFRLDHLQHAARGPALCVVHSVSAKHYYLAEDVSGLGSLPVDAGLIPVLTGESLWEYIQASLRMLFENIRTIGTPSRT